MALHSQAARPKTITATPNSQRRLDDITRAFRTAPVALAISRVDDGVVLDVSDRYLELFSFARREDVVGHRILDLGVYVDAKMRRDLMRRLRSEGGIEAMPLAFRAVCGEPRLTLVSMARIEVDGADCVVTKLRDVIREGSREGTADGVRFGDWSATLLEQYFDALVVVMEGRFVYANQRFTRLSGYSVGELFHRPPEDLTTPEARDSVMQRIEELEAGGPERARTYWLRRKDGSLIPVEALSRKIELGERAAVLAAVRDISDRLRAEEALRDSEERFRLLAEHAQDMVFRYRLLEPRGFEYVSPAVTAIAGYRPEDYYADPDFVQKIVYPDDRERFTDAIRNRLTQPVEVRWICCDGRVIWTEQRCSFIEDKDGAVMAIEGIVRDITARKQADEKLQEARDVLETGIEQRLGERGDVYGLTVRELSDLQLVAGGMTDKEIAQKLGVSVFTAQKHLSNVLRKMEAGSRAEAVARALREGLIE